MRHKRSGFKLKRDSGSRKAMLKGLVTSVIEHERVVTTVTKAKAVRPLVEKMITLAKAIPHPSSSRGISRNPGCRQKTIR
jgi:large subunit ribosomal protein L17